MHAGLPAVERRPADVVSQPLIIQDQFTDRVWELVTLPSALKPPAVLTRTLRGGGTRRLDRVGRCTEFVCGDVRHRCGLSSSKCGVPSGSAQRSCRSLGMTSRIAGLRHLDLAACPCPGLLERPARPRVERLRRFEQVQDVFCTRCGPQGEQLMVGVCERPPTADGDEARVANFREDHGCPPFKSSKTGMAYFGSIP